ncbi:hypothetical protein QTP88_008211 [Uroleucon formosanum]
MNITYAQGIVLIVLACVLHTNCANNEKSSTKSNKPLAKVPSKSNHKDNKKSLGDQKNIDETENMLLNIATIIQRCIDERTMNNKEFKLILDKLYKKSVMKKLQKLTKKLMVKVHNIKKKYETDVEVLKIINSMPDSSKNKNEPSKKSNKK